jgi:hypothetical protein
MIETIAFVFLLYFAFSVIEIIDRLPDHHDLD